MIPKVICLSLSSLCLFAASDSLRADDWTYSLRAGVGNGPRYSGSDERATAPLLGAGVEAPYGFFLSTDKGLGWKNDWEHFSFSTYVGASDERRDRKSSFRGSDRLKGMGTIHSRPQFGVTGAYTLGPVILAATLEHALEKDSDRDTGSSYNKLDLSLTSNLYKGRFGSLDGSIGGQFGNADYVRTWYGVSRAQSASSGFRPYKTHGGLVSRSASLNWTVPVSDSVEFSTVLDMRYLSGSAADSPIVERRLQTSLMGQIEYTF